MLAFGSELRWGGTEKVGRFHSFARKIESTRRPRRELSLSPLFVRRVIAAHLVFGTDSPFVSLAFLSAAALGRLPPPNSDFLFPPRVPNQSTLRSLAAVNPASNPPTNQFRDREHI